MEKSETYNQTLHDNHQYTKNTQTQTLTQDVTMTLDIINRIMSKKKKTIAFSQEPIQEESQVQNLESKGQTTSRS